MKHFGYINVYHDILNCVNCSRTTVRFVRSKDSVAEGNNYDIKTTIRYKVCTACGQKYRYFITEKLSLE